jgi:2-methylcitrate dehydratase PrpD
MVTDPVLQADGNATAALVAAVLARFEAPEAATPSANALLTRALIAACDGIEHPDAQRLTCVVAATTIGGSLPAPGDPASHDAASIAFLTAARARLGGPSWHHPINGRAAIEACAAAAWAEGLSVRAPWSRLVAAFVVGVEAQQWLVSVLRTSPYGAALDLPSLSAVVGAGFTAGLLSGLVPDQLTQAIGIAASQTVGTPLMDPTPAGVIHAARPAANGVMAVHLAKAGYTGPMRVLEVHRGLFAVLVQSDVAAWPAPSEANHLAELSCAPTPVDALPTLTGPRLSRIAALHLLSDQLRTRFAAPDATLSLVHSAIEEARTWP